MRNILISAIFFMFGGMLLAADAPQASQEVPAPAWVSGAEWVKQLDKNFQDGRYKEFLSKEDQIYQKGVKDNKWHQMSQKYQVLEEFFKKLDQKVNQLEPKEKALMKERDQALREVAKADPKAPISAMIQARLSLPELSQEQQQALRAFGPVPFSVIPFPTHADSPLMKQLNDIAFEYFVKDNELPEFFPKEGPTTPADVDLLIQYTFVLDREKFDKMLAVAQKSKETDLTDNLKAIVSARPIIYAQVLDEMAIAARANSGETEADKKVAKILEDFQAKTEALWKEDAQK